MFRTLTLISFLFLTSAVIAQAPSAEWRTIELPHFRVHYPAPYEAWATRAAERLESIRQEVSQEIGFTPPQIIDVLIMNPIAQPNGVAWPLLDSPRMIFYTEPPGPDEQLGAYGHWIDLLAVHETAHLVHMLRPSRSPLGRLLERSVLPFNPITLRAPRWVLEGYATVIEGRLTGAGRPSSTLRALILRRWAENGRLPSYGQLDGDQRFLGMSMAYLAGSAYLEWLEQRNGPGSLRNLWARLTAREKRSFDEAFAGVFGDRPDRLYGQFAAELTASAVMLRRESIFQDGVPFQATPRASGNPAVSPDGAQIALVLRPKDQPAKLVVWSTGPATEQEQKYAERIDKILARDPEDVAPFRTQPLPREPEHSLTLLDGGDIDTPRWTRDGKAILFEHRTPDAEGVLRFDLYRWDFKKVTRLTRLADVRDADPVDAQHAVAVRSRYGASQLVTIDLATGMVTPRGEASIDTVITHPRASPDGRQIAYVAHRGGRWELQVGEQRVPLPGDPAAPAWLSHEELVVTVFSRGFAELHRVRLQGGSEAITRTAGGAFDAAPSPDGRVFFMTLDPDGFSVRVLESVAPAPAPPPWDEALVPALPPEPSAPPAQFSAEPVPPSRPYGVGRQEWNWLCGTSYGPDHRAFEVGLRLGDVLGRLDTILVASAGGNDENANDAPAGVALVSAWRGWPVKVHAHAFTTDDENDGSDADAGDGLELRVRWTRPFPRSRVIVEAGALSDDRVFAGAAFGTRQVLGRLRLEEALRLEVDDEHYRTVLGVSARSGSFKAGAQYQRDRGATVELGGLSSSILPRSAYALRVLDPALPLSTLSGESYEGWRVESTLPGISFLTAFYQRHALDTRTLSLAGVEAEVVSDPMPVLKLPGLTMTAGIARVLDEPLRGATQWWIGMRWHP